MAHRLIQGMIRRDAVMALDILKEGLAAGQFLSLDHTRKWAREEFFFPGPSIDRVEGMAWKKSDGRNAAERAHEEVARILAGPEEALLDDGRRKELLDLAESD